MKNNKKVRKTLRKKKVKERIIRSLKLNRIHRQDENTLEHMKFGLKININLDQHNGREPKQDKMHIGMLLRNMGNKQIKFTK